MILKPGKHPCLVLSIFLLLGISISLAACQAPAPCLDPLGCLGIRPGASIRIGFEKAVIGEDRFASEMLLEDLQQILAQRQAAHVQPPIELAVFDTTCSASDRVQDAARIAVSPDLAALVGPACQSGSSEFLQLLSNAGMTLVSPVLISLPSFPGIYPALPSPPAQARLLSQFLTQKWGKREILVAFENVPILESFSNSICIEFAGAGLSCTARVVFDSIADLPALVSESGHPDAPIILVITALQKLNSLPDFSAGPAAQAYYFYDPYLSSLPGSIGQKGNLYAISVSRIGSNSITSNQPFSACVSQMSLTALDDAISKTFQKDYNGMVEIPRMAMRKHLDDLWAPNAASATPAACSLALDDFSIIPLATSP